MNALIKQKKGLHVSAVYFPSQKLIFFIASSSKGQFSSLL